MSTRRVSPLWGSVATLWALAAAMLALSPTRIRPTAPTPLSMLLAAVAGALLFGALAGRHARLLRLVSRARFPRLAARLVYILLQAGAEEIVWRWFALGYLAQIDGDAVGLVVSSLGFALAHTRRQGWRGLVTHLLTGCVFGAVYLASGSILAAIAAHVSYNLLIAAAAEGRRATMIPLDPAEVRPTELADRLEPDDRRAVLPRGVSSPWAEPVAELHQVRKRLGSTQALAGVDLELRRGEILALLGPNGAGKTTAVSLLLGLRPADTGTVVFFGHDPRKRLARRRVGATPQDIAFPPTLTVAEVVDFTAAHYPRPLGRDLTLERFGLADIGRKQCGGLSGGQRRRLAAALAFVGTPEAVVLDEPTTGLDVEARQILWNEIRAFAAGGGTVLLTTHYLDEAEQLADRIVVMARGSVVAEGTVPEIRTRAGRKRVRLAQAPAPNLLDDVDVIPAAERFECLVEDPEPFLLRLVHAGASLAGVEVAPVSLDEAFIVLVRETP